MNEEYQKLYTYLQEQGMTDLSMEDWYAKYSQPTEFGNFYTAITDPDRDTVAVPLTTDLGKEEFYKKYFGDVVPDELKKKDPETPLAPSSSALDGNQTSLESPQLSAQEQFGLGSIEASDTHGDLMFRNSGRTASRRNIGGLIYTLKNGEISLADMTPDLRDMRQRDPLRVNDDFLYRNMQQQGFLMTSQLLQGYRDSIQGEDKDIVDNALRGMATYDVNVFQGLDDIAGVLAKDAEFSKTAFGIEVEPFYGGVYIPGSYSGAHPVTPEMGIEERKRLISQDLVKRLYGEAANIISSSLPEQHRNNSESLKYIEDDLFERTHMLIDMDNDGVVNVQPMIEWGGMNTGVYNGQMVSWPKFDGYLPDLFRAGALDLINGAANLFGAPDENVRERRERAQSYRDSAMQFTDASGDMSWGNYFKSLAGRMTEGAPFFLATFPLQVYTGGRLSAMNMSTNGIIGVMALESTAMLTMQEWARITDNDEFKTYTKDGKQYSYGEVMVATGGDPELMLGYESEVDVASSLGYLASVAGTNFAVDGLSSRFFMRALRGTPTHTLHGPQMGKWWGSYLSNMGIAVPQGGLVSSLQAMQQYIAYQESTGREVDWAEVRQVGMDALPTGAAYAATLTTAGQAFNYFQGARALARDKFGRGMQNMTYLKEIERIESRLFSGVSPEEALVLAREKLALENLNLRRQLYDTEFYRSMNADDRETLLIITDEMNQQRRLMMMLRDEENPLYKKAQERIEVLAKERQNIESLYEADPRPVRYDDDGNLLDRDPFAEGEQITLEQGDPEAGIPGVYDDPRAAPGYGPFTPRMRPIAPRQPKGLMWDPEQRKMVYRTQLEGDKPYYESIIDQYRGIENFQRDIQEREGLGLRVDESMDVVSMMTLIESRAAALSEVDNRIFTEKKNGLFDIIRGGSKTNIGKGIDKLTGRRTTQKIIDENIDALTAVMPEGVELNPLSLFEQYRYALHAPERNDYIYSKNKAEYDELAGTEGRTFKQNERMRDLARYMEEKRGSGMTDEQAQRFIDALPDELLPRLDEGNTKLNEMVSATQDALLKYGFIDEATYNELKTKFQYYTPLYGRAIGDNTLIDPTTGEVRVSDNAYSSVRGQTYLDNKFLQEAKGRSEQTGDVIAKMQMQNLEVHLLGQRNVAMTKLHNLMLGYPDSKHRVVDNGNANAANTQVVYIDGKRKYMEFYNADGTPNTRVLAGLKDQGFNFDNPVSGGFMTAFQLLSGLRKVHTNYSLEFGPYALLRDYVGAVQNAVFLSEQKFGYALRTESGMPVDHAAFQADILNPARVMKSWGMVALDATNLPKKLTGEDLALVQEFIRAGGETGWISMQPLRDLQKQLDAATTQEQQWTLSGTWLNKYGFELIESLNGTFENAVRFNAYRTARERGMSVDMAANVAKEISVNFNRKGTETSTLAGVKYFINPGIQGTTQYLSNMFTARGNTPDVDAYGNPVSKLTQLSPKLKAGGGLAALGMLSALWNIAMDYEDATGVPVYDRIQDWEKYSRISFIDPNGTDGERYGVTTPYGYGANIAFGIVATDLAMGRTNEFDAALFMTETMKHHISPIYLAGPSDQDVTEGKSPDAGALEGAVSLVVPDWMRGPVELFANKSLLTGREIFRDDPNVPDSEEIRLGPESLKFWMQDLNEWGEGSSKISGDYKGIDVDWNTDPLWYLMDSYLGSNLRAFEKASGLQRDIKLESMDPDAIQGFVDTDDIPFIRRFIRDNGGDDAIRAQFIQYMDRMSGFKAEFQDQIGARKYIGKSQVYREQKLKEVGEDSDDYRYLSYLLTLDFSQAVYDVSYRKSSGLGLPRQLLIEKQQELLREGLETEEQWQTYYDVTMDLQKLEDAQIALMTKFLKYAYTVSPPDVN